MRPPSQTILVVDDQETNRKLLRVTLEAEGYVIREAQDGFEALSILANEHVDAVVSDILMPRMNGYRLCSEIRRSDTFRNMPFLVLSSTYTSASDEKMAMELGADYFLEKPVPTATLIEALDGVIKRGASARAQPPSRLNEPDLLQEYSDRLVDKLEKKNIELLVRSTALETAANAVVITDDSAHIQWVNAAFTALSGYSAEEAIGNTPRILKSGQHDEAHYRALWSTIKSGASWRGEFCNRRKDGALYYGEQTITPVRAQGGPITHFIGIMNDVTQRKRAAEELRRTAEQLQHLLEHSPAVIYSLSVSGDQVAPRLISENITRLLNYTSEELMSYDLWLSHLHPDDRDEAIAGVAETLKLGATVHDYRLRHADGHYVWVQDSRRVISDENGVAREIVGVFADVTERKLLEARVTFREQQFNAFFAGAPAGLAVFDNTLRYSQVNDTLAEINGIPAADHIGKTVSEVLPSLAPFVEPLLWRVLATHKPILNRELSGETPKEPGVERHWMISLFPLPGTEDRPEEIGVLAVEITDRKRAEEALSDSEEKFRQLAENIQEVFWISDSISGKMLYISPAFERIWGRTCESLYASPDSWRDAIHPEDRERVRRESVAQGQGRPYNVEYRIIRKDGSVRWIHDRGSPIRNAAGEIYRVAGVAEDVTAQRLAADQMREQASLLEHARDAILVKDLNHRITYWNKSAEKLYGWTSGEVIGRDAVTLLYKSTERFLAATDSVLANGEWTGELPQVCKDGHEIVVEGRWTLLQNNDGVPYAVLSLNTDLTEKKELEQQFLRAQRMEGIGTLAGGIAHDLNNVLGPIIMAVDLLRMVVTDKKGLELLDLVNSSAKRGAEMVGQVLFFARGTGGQRIEVSSKAWIEDIEKIIRDTFPKNIQIRTEANDELWPICGDPTQLHQVLLNLCVNARDAMPYGGELTIAAENLYLDAQYVAMNIAAQVGPYVAVRIRDTGTGISKSNLEKIFDPFFTTKPLGKGTGLGLSTSMAIVKSHGGFLRVTSEEGKGTEFRLFFPALTDAPTQNIEGETFEFPRGDGETILVVDDEASIREITMRTLEAFGYRVLLASDGAEAVRLYAQHQSEIAAVLTDIMMPIMDGHATIQVLTRMNPKVRIIAASGHIGDHEGDRLATMGVKHLLAKPYTAGILLTVVKRVLTEDTPR